MVMEHVETILAVVLLDGGILAVVSHLLQNVNIVQKTVPVMEHADREYVVAPSDGDHLVVIKQPRHLLLLLRCVVSGLSVPWIVIVMENVVVINVNVHHFGLVHVVMYQGLSHVANYFNVQIMIVDRMEVVILIEPNVLVIVQRDGLGVVVIN